MKQTPSAIIVLAAAIFAAGASISFSVNHINLGNMCSVLGVITGATGCLALIRACLLDHEMAVGVNGRLDFLEELVYLEKLAMEHRRRAMEQKGAAGKDAVSYQYDRYAKKSA